MITWSETGSDTFPTNVILNSALVYSTDPVNSSFIGESLYIRGNTTDLTKADIHKLNIGFEITHPNPNISGARTDETFELHIWRRAYLSVNMSHNDMPLRNIGAQGICQSCNSRTVGNHQFNTFGDQFHTLGSIQS
jgi:hypothetical protein